MHAPVRSRCSLQITISTAAAAACSFADIIIPWQRGDNLVAIDLITQHIALKLRCHDLLRIYPNLQLLPSNFQVRVMNGKCSPGCVYVTHRVDERIGSTIGE
jgi:hypothetical protein